MSSSVSTVPTIFGGIDLNNRREYAIVGMQAHTVVDVTEPTAPVVVGEITGQHIWRDIKVYQYFDSAAGRLKRMPMPVPIA